MVSFSFQRRSFEHLRILTIGDVAVAAILYDVTEVPLDTLIASKVKSVGWAGPQNRDVKAPQGSHEALGSDDAL